APPLNSASSTNAFASLCRSIASATSTASSRRRTSCWPARSTAKRTSSPSTCGARAPTSSGASWPRSASLLRDGRARDAIAQARASAQHEHDFDGKEDQRQVAGDRPPPPAPVAGRRHHAQAEHLLAEGAPFVAVAK